MKGRRRGPRLVLGALAMAGLLISAYLTWVHYMGVAPICVGGSGGARPYKQAPTLRSLGFLWLWSDSWGTFYSNFLGSLRKSTISTSSFSASSMPATSSKVTRVSFSWS